MICILRDTRLLKASLLAGAAGGAAELAWIGLYSAAIAAPGAEIARQVTATVLPDAVHAAWAPTAGVALHMVLSVMLGIAFVAVLWGTHRRAPTAAAVWYSSVAGFAAIWAMNFLWILPALNPAFVALLPPGVTLASKILFGLAMAGVLLHRIDRARRPAQRLLFLESRLHHPFQR
jgi:hypothetical protein